MEKHTVTQEILLVTASSFAQRDLCGDGSENEVGIPRIPADRLEEACWNGLLDDFLAGAPKDRKHARLFLWKIHVADAFVCVELAQSPGEIEAIHSLDPQLFLSLRNRN